MKLLAMLLLLVCVNDASGMSVREYRDNRMSPATFQYLSGFMAGLREYNRMLMVSPDAQANKSTVICAHWTVYTPQTAINIAEQHFERKNWYPGVLDSPLEQVISQGLLKLYPCK